MGVLWTLGGCCSVQEEVRFVEERRPFTARAVAVSVAGGVTDDSLFRYLREHGVARCPSVDEVLMLKHAGASDVLVIAMIRAQVNRPRAASLDGCRWLEVDLGFMGRIALWTLGGVQIGGDPPPPPRERRTVKPPDRKKDR